MNTADRKRLIALLNRINQREPQKDDDLLLLARGYEDMALDASRAATAAARAEVARQVRELPVYSSKLDPLSSRFSTVSRAAVLALVEQDAAQRHGSAMDVFTTVERKQMADEIAEQESVRRRGIRDTAQREVPE